MFLPQLLVLYEDLEAEVTLSNQVLSYAALAEELQCLEVQEHSAITYHALFGGNFSTNLDLQVIFIGVKCLRTTSTHNFIQASMVNFLQLKTEQTPCI